MSAHWRSCKASATNCPPARSLGDAAYRQDLAGRGRDAQPCRRRQPDVRRAGREGINIRMISTSEIKISVVVDEKYLELGVRALHEAFQLDRELAA